MQRVGAGYLSHESLVVDGCLGIVAGTEHMLGSSRITDDQEAAGRPCKYTARGQNHMRCNRDVREGRNRKGKGEHSALIAVTVEMSGVPASQAAPCKSCSLSYVTNVCKTQLGACCGWETTCR